MTPAQRQSAADIGALQTKLFGDQRRLDPSFYSGLSTDLSGWRAGKGTETRDELISTLARLRQENLDPATQDQALEALRGAGLNTALPPGWGAGGHNNRVNPMRAVSSIPSLLGPVGELWRGQTIGSEKEMEDELLRMLQPGGQGPDVGPLAPEYLDQLKAFYQRRAAGR
jgi:hypothetical protein